MGGQVGTGRAAEKLNKCFLLLNAIVAYMFEFVCGRGTLLLQLATAEYIIILSQVIIDLV